jgi:hypothetical protein
MYLIYMKKIFLFLSLQLFSICCFSQSRNISAETKRIVYTRDGGTCNCCGSSQNIEYDHYIPYSCGGESDASNVQLLCQRCNRSKSNSCYCKVHDKKVGARCCEGETHHPPSSSSGSEQCMGTTKKGARCKKMTTNSNGRCNTHQ